jgi:parvulin-like peptidyl-prolyl isomerase
MPDGTPVPPLPLDAPRQVKVGVILFQYQGAQLAPPTARAKTDAKALADKVAPDAKGDFHGGVQKGDNGFSFDDAGIIYRGSLEPAMEYVVFNLKPGDVSDPIDTPRGYWIVKRIE